MERWFSKIIPFRITSSVLTSGFDFWFLFCQDVGNDKLILGLFYFEDKKTKQDPVPFSSFYNFWLLTKYIRVRIKILPRISMKIKDKIQKGCVFHPATNKFDLNYDPANSYWQAVTTPRTTRRRKGERISLFVVFSSGTLMWDPGKPLANQTADNFNPLLPSWILCLKSLAICVS